MVGSVVEEPVGVLSPLGGLLGEEQRQPRQEHEHDVVVGVELRQAQVELPVGVEGSDHAHAVTERLVADGVLLAPLPPLLVAEVEVWQPGLVYVDDASSTLKQLEHLLGVVHPGHKASLRVASVLNLLQNAVSHVEGVPQHVSHQVNRDIELLGLENVSPDLLCCPNMLTLLDVLLYVSHQGVMSLLLLVFLFADSRVRMLRQPYGLD